MSVSGFLTARRLSNFTNSVVRVFQETSREFGKLANRQRYCQFIVIFMSWILGAVSLVDAVDFFSDVLPAWQANHNQMTNMQIVASISKTGGVGTAPVVTEPTVMRIWLRAGMVKMEWEKSGNVRNVFGTDGKHKFSLGPFGESDGGPLGITQFADAAGPTFNQDPLYKETSKIFSAYCVHPGLRLHELRLTDFDAEAAKLRELSSKKWKLKISIAGGLEKLDLTLDPNRNWAITEWTRIAKPFMARGINRYFDNTSLGNFVPSVVEFEVVGNGGNLIEAWRTEYELPASCEIASSAFTLAHYGFTEPSTHPDETAPAVGKWWYIGLGILGIALIAFALLRSSKQKQ